MLSSHRSRSSHVECGKIAYRVARFYGPRCIFSHMTKQIWHDVECRHGKMMSLSEDVATRSIHVCLRNLIVRRPHDITTCRRLVPTRGGYYLIWVCLVGPKYSNFGGGHACYLPRTVDFCHAMLCISAAYAVMRCLSVCVSICYVSVFYQND